MKKMIIALCALLAFGGAVRAQEAEPVAEPAAQSASEEQSSSKYFPNSGQIGLGINALPVFQLLGTVFHDNVTGGGITEFGFRGRYFLSSSAAIRMSTNFNIGTTLTTTRKVIVDDVAGKAGRNGILEDVMKERRSDYTFQVGYMMFKGKERFRAFYGADVLYKYSRRVEDYEYANVMNDKNAIPTSTNFGNNLIDGLVPKDTRVLYRDGGALNTIGLDLFAGIEYYFIPRACIGFEVGVMAAMDIASREEVDTETIRNGGYFKEEKIGGKRESTMTFHSHSPLYGNFFLMFHF